MTVLVCVPSRGRPHNIHRLLAAVNATRVGDVAVWVGVDADDPSRPAYQALCDRDGVFVDVAPRRPLAFWWNDMAAQVLEGSAPVAPDLVCWWGDDVVPETQGWDADLTTAAGTRNLVYPCDGYWDDIPSTILGHARVPTAVSMPIPVLRALGGAVPVPNLQHLYSDDVWRDLGVAAGCLVWARHVMVRHYHPTHADHAYRAPLDDTYHEGGVNGAKWARDDVTYRAWLGSPQFHASVRALQELR